MDRFCQVLMACFMFAGVTAAPLAAAECSGPKTVVEIAAADSNFSTLVKALKAAELVETLKGKGPFTVLAPTNEAFDKLPKGALEGLLKKPEVLRAVLLQHVIAGKVMAEDVVKLKSAKTMLGQKVSISSDDGVMIGGAKVTKADIMASNGVIHVIDTVILPANDIVEAARANDNFKTLLKALEVAGLTDALRGEGPFTVFAPTDRAFAKLPEGTIDALLKDKAKLKKVLTYHVVSGKVLATDAAKLKSAKTLEGSEIKIDASEGVKINDATVIKADVPATNGVIHVIDTVLLPQ